jgi:hypothetical protein
MSVAFDDSERIVTTSGGDSGRPPRRRLSLLSPRGKKAGIAVLVAIVLVGGALTVASWTRSPSTGAAVTALSPFAVPGRGAAVPFVEQEAESAATTGKILAADRHYGTLAAEASGRRAVTLTAVGQYVEFTLARPANAMSLRYSIPDSADGKGREATLDVIAGGSTVAVPVTSRYGWFYGEYPFTDTPGSAPHHFFDEARTLLGKTLPAGSQVRVQVPSPAASPSFTIDLADFEQVAAPLAKPAGAISGSLSDSLIDDVWLQHTEAGIWMDGPMDDLTVRDSRILDQTADGVNFHRGVTHSTVADTFVRNTGDDGLAMWSDGLPDTGSSFVHDTVVAPVLANNIAIYGGRDVTVSDNVVADTVTNGGGLHVANRFDGVRGASAVSGTFTLARNTLIRAGNADTNWNYGVGALWFDGLNAPITGAKIAVTATDIVDSSYEAIQFVEGTITGVSFSDVTITGAGTYALQIQAPGSASFDHVTATGIAQSTSIYQCPGTDFAIAQGTGNAGWFTVTPVCGAWPEPQWQDGFTAPARAAAPVSMASTAATIAPPSAPVAGVTKAAKPTSSPTPHKTTKKPAPVDTTTDVARGKPVQESGHTDVYPGQNVTDGSATTYWESPQNAFPASVTIDLGKATTLGRVVLKLPPLAAWNSRVQTLSVIGSTDGRTFTTLSGSAPHTFDAAKGNTVTLRFARTQKRYVKVVITANAGWPAGQLSEVEAYGG